MLARLEGASLL